MQSYVEEEFAEMDNSLFGWVYTLSWSLSFYPQPILNVQRQSTHGFSPDFSFTNVLGFAALTASTAAFLYSPVIRQEYADRHPGSPEPTARFNDLAFAAHAFLLTVITATQFWPRLWGWPKPEVVPITDDRTEEDPSKQEALGGKRGSLLTKLICGTAVLFVAVLSVVVAAKKNSTKGQRESSGLDWIDVVYSLQYVKLVLTIYKYIPQVLSNYLRQSTSGWSISTILFDFTGGVLSMLQLVLDSAVGSDWSGVTGNPGKVGLSLISLFFDTVFLVQHYVLYGYGDEDNNGLQAKTDDETTPLVRGEA
jgi:cystinosin